MKYTARRPARAFATLASIAGLLLATMAFARPGGGGSYSGGHSSGGGSSSGGGDVGGLIFQLLFWLVFEHPVIGIPLVLLTVVLYARSARSSGSASQTDWSTHASPSPRSPSPDRRKPSPLGAMTRIDSTFSPIIFEDFVYSLYAEIHVARGASQLDRLSAYMTADVARVMMQATEGPVSTVIVGSMRVDDVVAASGAEPFVTASISIEANYTEGKTSYYTVERWRLRRRLGVASRAPARVKVLGCPSCGAPQDALFGGSCRHCNKVVNDGSFDWCIVGASVAEKHARPPMLTGTTEERGTDFPTVYAPDAQARWSELCARDPALTWEALGARIGLVFSQFQSAWSARDLASMRPFLSDALFTTQSYWINAYVSQRLRNITEKARITGLECVKVESDPYFDAITVRLRATGLDYTVRDADGTVVGGNRSRERAYTEYWTLIRGTQRKGAPRADLNCPNCGAPVEVNMAGHCKYCKVKVTTGDFDWVLSKIQQDESYEG